MKKLTLAIFISLLLHLLLFLNYHFKEKEPQEEGKTIQEKSDIKFVKLAQKQAPQEPSIPPQPQPKVEEPKIEKNIEKPIIQEPKIVEKKPTIPQIPKPKKPQKEIKEAKKFQKEILKESSKLQDSTLEKFLSQKTHINREILNELEQLYGKEYDTFTKVQKAYLEENLNRFQVITQRVLNRMGYPKLAAKLRIGGINIVEFMFYPNGNISDLKIINSSGYTILDDYTLELIQIAYKDYPKPKEPTKLRFKVFYRIY